MHGVPTPRALAAAPTSHRACRGSASFEPTSARRHYGRYHRPCTFGQPALRRCAGTDRRPAIRYRPARDRRFESGSLHRSTGESAANFLNQGADRPGPRRLHQSFTLCRRPIFGFSSQLVRSLRSLVSSAEYSEARKVHRPSNGSIGGASRKADHPVVKRRPGHERQLAVWLRAYWT